nr:60S ribosomal protein L34 [Tanacetum cinerariifolium]
MELRYYLNSMIQLTAPMCTARRILDDIDFEGMTIARLSKILQGTCMFPVKGIFFLVPGKELSNVLIQIKSDLDLANCIAIGYKNEKVIDMFLEHHGYDLSHWIQTDTDNNDDEIFDVEMEDITGYTVSDFVGEDDVVIPNRPINDPFLNKLCNGSYINDFSNTPDVGESSEPCGKELEIDSDDEDVGKQFKLVDRVIYLAFDPKLPWNKMKPTLGLRFEHPEQLKDCLTNYDVANGYQLWYRRNDYRILFVLCGRDLAEGRSGGKKGKKGDWPYKKEKDEDELPKKDKSKLLRAPKKDRNPNSWCRAFFKTDRGCATYENGISESYHNSIRIARGKPLITMLKEIRVYLMQRLYIMHNLAANLGDSITPSIRKEIERLKHSQRYWTVYPCGNNVFEVRKGDDSYGVNIDNRTCACKWWDLSGVPCVHSVAAFSFITNDPILGVSAWYSKKMWQNAYSYFIKQWVVHLCGPKLQKSLLCHQSLERYQ